MWSLKHKRCLRCGTISVKHVARGLCVSCYNKFLQRRHRGKRTTRGLASKKLTKEYLVSEYIGKKKSLRDIAKECYCTSQYVHKKMIEYDVPLRNRKSARSLALTREKVRFTRIGDESQVYKVVLRKQYVNKSFFSKWSPAMAYVLGIIYTDGSLKPSKKRDSLRKSTSSVDSLWLRQKEPELLKKILILMNSNAKILLTRRKKYKGKIQGETYYIYIYNIKIYEDLVNLGLTPDKSRKVKFPEVPPRYVRHFIRGCWDGDGSVFYEKRRPHYLIAHFVSGSQSFIKSLVEHLKKAGLPERTIYKTKGRPPSYYIKYSGYQCKKLYYYLYDNVSSTQYLERKYSLFKGFAEKWLL